ncbi:lytic transglycosylase domain-containing protein [Sphingomonas sp. RHCKR47]|uniref:lytic transglycosylase domain-containing protein n=1 Tax=Sphingomonas citricola TaxID=2862498 RepID=UPI001CA577D5|nr:lytic transglycosylase domain-containing protein [Sphingomonas citricola]MBW6524073.1 lytic transglycosylase domain-containing protein [Sphingomonas citricola]
MTVSAITSASQRVTSAIQRASARTGIDFQYLMGQAKLESGFNVNARAGTSSASGLYQFIEQSWLGVMKQHGGEHGLSWAADSIQKVGGRYVVTGGNRDAVLGLRNDPEVASLMAAEHASDNKAAIEGATGRPATGTDLYMAHFLGLGGAKQFLSAMASNPARDAASLFPAAAHANRSVFYTSDGSARSLSDVYQRFASKLGDGADASGSGVAATGNLSTMQFAAQALGMGDDATVVTGAGESASDALSWARSTLGQIKGQAAGQASLLRPSPDNARLAYLMLASMGGR